MAPTLDRQTLRDALTDLGRRAYAEGRTIEISIYGGSALIMVFDWRLATRDVDAVFEADRATVRRLAAEIASERNWDATWLNDGVKGFLSSKDSAAKDVYGAFPSLEQPGLRVMVANPRYLLAMKCRAMRLGGEESQDVADIRHLAAETGIATAREALDLVAEFYPNKLIEPKTQFGLEEIFAQGPRP